MIQYKVGKQIITGVVKMDSYTIFKDIAIILVAAKRLYFADGRDRGNHSYVLGGT